MADDPAAPGDGPEKLPELEHKKQAPPLPHDDALDGDPIGDDKVVDQLKERSLAHRIALFQGLVLGTISLVAGVAVLLYQVQRPGTWDPHLPEDPTPIGYLIGLTIYVVPMVAALYMLAQVRSFALYKKTLLYSVLSMFAALFLVDVLLVGSAFFHFPNCGAYTFYIPAYDPIDGVWEGASVPIEDVLFYFVAIACTCVTYVWASLYWFPMASPYFRNGRLHASHAWEYVKQVEVSWWAVIVGVVGIAGAYLLQRYMGDVCASGPGDGEGFARFCLSAHPTATCIDGVSTPVAHEPTANFPWYWSFLTLSAVLPTIFLGRRVGRLVNWPAFTFTFTGMVLVSVILAVTMAVPYQWWAFEPDVMIGLYFNAWFGVPIEQTFLYLITPWVSVLYLEFLHAWLSRGNTMQDDLGEGYPAVDLSFGDKPPVLPS